MVATSKCTICEELAPLPRLVATDGSVELQWFGNPSPELLKAAQDFRMAVSVYSKMQGR
jgi:hypothetical protein